MVIANCPFLSFLMRNYAKYSLQISCLVLPVLAPQAPTAETVLQAGILLSIQKMFFCR